MAFRYADRLAPLNGMTAVLISPSSVTPTTCGFKSRDSDSAITIAVAQSDAW